jgi:hypothetical protein
LKRKYVRRALGGDDVAEDAGDAVVGGAPRERRERLRVGHGDHVRLLDRVEAGDARAVERRAFAERVLELVAADAERLQVPEDVGEPQPDEPDVALLADREDVGGRARLVGHERAD